MLQYIMRVLLLMYMINSLSYSISHNDIGSLVWAIVFWTLYIYFYPVYRKTAQIKE